MPLEKSPFGIRAVRLAVSREPPAKGREAGPGGGTCNNSCMRWQASSGIGSWRRRPPMETYTNPLTRLQTLRRINGLRRQNAAKAVGGFVFRTRELAPIGRHFAQRVCRSTNAAKGNSDPRGKATRDAQGSTAAPTTPAQEASGVITNKKSPALIPLS